MVLIREDGVVLVESNNGVVALDLDAARPMPATQRQVDEHFEFIQTCSR